MSFLAFDTTTTCATVALSHGGKIYTHHQEGSLTHSEVILEMIHLLYAEAKSSLDTLEGIAFGRGPGSFTGVRMACSIAKGLGYARDILLYPVSDLLLIAYTAQKQFGKDTPLLVVIDARMHQWYWLLLEGNESSIEQLTDPSCIRIDKRSLCLVGVGGHDLYSLLPEVTQRNIMHLELIYPKASDMIEFVHFTKMQGLSAVEVEPVYLRDQVVHRGKNG